MHEESGFGGAWGCLSSVLLQPSGAAACLISLSAAAAPGGQPNPLVAEAEEACLACQRIASLAEVLLSRLDFA